LADLHVLRAIAGLELIFAESFLANRAIHQWVTEVGEVAAGLKYLWWTQYRGVNQHHIVALLHHRAHPCVFDVAQHQRAQRAVIIRRPEPAINFSTRVDETASLGEVYDLFEFASGHQIRLPIAVLEHRHRLQTTLNMILHRLRREVRDLAGGWRRRLRQSASQSATEDHPQ